MARKPDPRSKGIRTVRPHTRPNGRSLRTKDNADKIIELVEAGNGLIEIAKQLMCDPSAIAHWLRDDEVNGGREIAQRYARATEFRWDQMAEGLLQLAGRPCLVDGKPDNALVQQLRLEVDTRKWLLSKMHPRRFGDRVEIAGDANAPIVTRIELVAVEPASHARVIDNAPNEGENEG